MPAAPLSFSFFSQSVRAFADDKGEPWFCATDVCDILGYANAPDAITKHCREAGIAKRDISSGGQMRGLAFINEGNLYRLIIKSRKPEAQQFETWICDEVLPSIRKTGAYVHTPAAGPGLTLEQQHQLTSKIRQCTAGWIFNAESSGHIYNHLRVVFKVARWQDIPTEHYEVALTLIESKSQSAGEFMRFLAECRQWFAKEVLGAGTPWTPAIQRKLTAQMGQRVALPPSVDWLALADKTAKKGAD